MENQIEIPLEKRKLIVCIVYTMIWEAFDNEEFKKYGYFKYYHSDNENLRFVFSLQNGLCSIFEHVINNIVFKDEIDAIWSNYRPNVTHSDRMKAYHETYEVFYGRIVNVIPEIAEFVPENAETYWFSRDWAGFEKRCLLISELHKKINPELYENTLLSER